MRCRYAAYNAVVANDSFFKKKKKKTCFLPYNAQIGRDCEGIPDPPHLFTRLGRFPHLHAQIAIRSGPSPGSFEVTFRLTLHFHNNTEGGVKARNLAHTFSRPTLKWMRRGLFPTR